MWEKGPYVICEQRRSKSACACIQSDLDILCLSTSTSVSVDSENEGPDQPAQICRLIRASIVCQLHKGPFSALNILDVSGKCQLNGSSTDHDQTASKV